MSAISDARRRGSIFPTPTLRVEEAHKRLAEKLKPGVYDSEFLLR